ncbi:hypothetical protein [Maribacter halichondriae]|uniref:hypothetical protein n=1 Tax=Maribacter halichondriae TaxID=2980554 RepID=UPI0023598290|nr:hypothetical protein [Maribacter sp. Hal144]
MMNEFVFMNHNWIWPVVIGSILLFLFFFWKEWSNSPKQKIVVNAIVGLITIGSLALMALRPAIPQTLEMGGAVLLTEGYDQKKLDSLLESDKNLGIIRYDTNGPTSLKLDSITSLHILGAGIAPFDFWRFAEISVTYLGAKIPRGITRLQYEEKNTVDSELVVNGVYNTPTPGHKIILQGPGESPLDSVELNSSKTQTFSLSTTLKVEGKYVYALAEKDALGTTLSSEPLPIQVMELKPLRVLIINEFPSFETKYLKNYLAEMNLEVMVRSQLTKGKYKFEYFNRSRTPIYSFSSDNLKNFDVVILDATSYRNLTSSAFSILVTATREEGLGIFIQPDEELFRLRGKKSFFNFISNRNTEVVLGERERIKLESYPYSFDKELLLEPIQNSKGNILSAYRRLERGRVGTTVLKNTYQLFLEGHSDVYRRLWADIVGGISKKPIPNALWESGKMMPVQNHPYPFKIRTFSQKPQIENGVGSPIALINNPDIPSLWKGTIYPRRKGWNKLSLEQDTTAFDFYVIDSTQWKTLRMNQTMDANRIYFQQASKSITKKEILAPIERVWFFLVFILGIGYLWLEPKLRTDRAIK